jgi:RNA polymerase sigma-70 factor, ECF subfamily
MNLPTPSPFISNSSGTNRQESSSRFTKQCIISAPASCSIRTDALTYDAQPHEVTQLLLAWSGGDRAARDELMPLVYEELRRLAHRYMNRERPDHTLQTSALVNEAYLRLIDQKDVKWQNRAHFLGIAAQMMRRILVDHARKRSFAKRGGAVSSVPLEEAVIVSPERAAEVIALDDALNNLTELDPRKSQIIELRFFGGLSIEETAEVLGVSPGTVMRDWTFAKAWLRREIFGAKSKS